MAEIHLAGYCDRFSARPGERLDIMVSAEGADQVELQLVRLIHGDENPEGPGFVEREIDAPVNGTHAVAKQHIQLGSFVRVADPAERLAPSGPVTLWAYIWPRTPADGRQGILTRWQSADGSGYALGISEDGALEFRVGDGAGQHGRASRRHPAHRAPVVPGGGLLRPGKRRGHALPGAGREPLQQPSLQDRAASALVPREREARRHPGFGGRGIPVGRRRGPRGRAGRLREPALQRQDRPRGRRRRGAKPRGARCRARGRRRAGVGLRDRLLGHHGRLHRNRHRRHRGRYRPARAPRRRRQPPGAGHDRLQLERPRGLLPLRAGAVRRHRVSTRIRSPTAAGSQPSPWRCRT